MGISRDKVFRRWGIYETEVTEMGVQHMRRSAAGKFTILVVQVMGFQQMVSS